MDAMMLETALTVLSCAALLGTWGISTLLLPWSGEETEASWQAWKELVWLPRTLWQHNRRPARQARPLAKSESPDFCPATGA